MIKEVIRIYQSGSKTTIVIDHMSEKTKQQIAQLLLGDLKVESVDELITKPIKVDEKKDTDTTTMQEMGREEKKKANRPSYVPSGFEEAYKARKTKPDKYLKVITDAYSRCEGSDKETYDQLILTHLSELKGEKSDKVLKALLYNGRDDIRFHTILKKLVVQKGCGDGDALMAESPDYRKALTNALKITGQDDLIKVYQAVLREFKVA